MLFTQKFNKSLLIYFLGFLIITLITVVQAKVLPDSTISTGLISRSFQIILFQTLLWAVIYYMTKDKSSSMTGYLITFTGIILLNITNYILFSDQEMNDTNEIISLHSLLNIIQTLIFSLSFGVFGKLHFKKLKGALLGCIPLLWMGTHNLLWPSSIHTLEFINQFLSYKNSIEIIDAIPIIQLLFSPIILLFFGWLYNEINNDKIADIFLFKSVTVNHTLNKLQFSIIYWMFRFIFLFGIILSSQIQFYQPKWLLIIYLITGSIGFYFMISIYRNFLLSYLLNLGRYPSWLYLALNIPVINFFAWLIVLMKKVNLQEIDLAKILKEYKIYDKNISIKRFLVIIGFVALIYSLLQLGFGKLDSFERPVIYFVSIGLFIWYFTEYRLVYYLVFALVLITMVSLVEVNQYGREIITFYTTSFSGMLAILAQYPLYHFDKLKINGLSVINEN